MNTSSINSANSFRVQGTVNSIDELSKNKPGMARKMTEIEVSALKEFDEQLRLNDLSAESQLKSDNIYGQVLVNGKVFATVYESGIAEMLQDVSGLTSDGSGLSIAKARLQEIAQAVKGEIRNSDFLPGQGGRYAPRIGLNSDLESAQRKANEVLQAMDWEVMRSRF